MDGNEGTQEVHPLLRGEISYIKDWTEWKELWESTKYAELRHSLLHFGFGVSCSWAQDEIERVCMYLEIADRYGSSWEFQKGERTEFSRRTAFGGTVWHPEELRRILAEKAFHVLCQNFFKNTESFVYRAPSWVQLATDPLVLEKLFWYFRLDEYGRVHNLPNSDDDHHIEIAREFAYSLCTFLWFCEDIVDGRYYGDTVYSGVKRTPPGTRLNIITLLFGLRRLNVLLDEKYELDDSCMKRLEELALGYDLFMPNIDSYGDKLRKPTTIQEALLGKSKVAEILLILRAKQTEKKRLDEIRALNMQRRELDRQIQSL